MSMFRAGLTVVVIVLLCTPGAWGQERPQRGYLDISAGAALPSQGTFETEGSSRTNPDYAWAFKHVVETGRLFDVGTGVFVTPLVGIGVAVSQMTGNGAPTVALAIPYSYDPSTDEAVGSTKLARSETAVHAHALFTVRPRRGLAVRVFGGPSYFRVTQELVYSFFYSPRYSSGRYLIDIQSYSFRKHEAFALGFNAGADLSVPLTGQLGVGVLIRFTHASVELPDTAEAWGGHNVPSAGPGMHAENGPVQRVGAGGLQLAAGVRARF